MTHTNRPRFDLHPDTQRKLHALEVRGRSLKSQLEETNEHAEPEKYRALKASFDAAVEQYQEVRKTQSWQEPTP